MQMSLQRPTKTQLTVFRPPSPAQKLPPRKVITRKKRVIRKRKRTVDTHGFPIPFVVKLRSEVRAKRPSVTHEELDQLVRRIVRRAPDWMFADYSASDDSSGCGSDRESGSSD
jgi:hypothetical protein